MKIEVEIPDEEMQECIKQLVAKRLLTDYSYDKNVYKREIAQAVRDVIYKDKENIVNMVVSRASREVKSKAIKKLLEDC